jgi:hypothetical protein
MPHGPPADISYGDELWKDLVEHAGRTATPPCTGGIPEVCIRTIVGGDNVVRERREPPGAFSLVTRYQRSQVVNVTPGFTAFALGQDHLVER